MLHKNLNLTKKEIVQHLNILLIYYPKEYALRDSIQFNSFTGLKIVQDNSDNHHQQKRNIHLPSSKANPKPIEKTRQKNQEINKKCISQE